MGPPSTTILQSGIELAVQGAIVLLAVIGFVLVGSLVSKLVTGEFAPSSIREQFRSGRQSADTTDRHSE